MEGRLQTAGLRRLVTLTIVLTVFAGWTLMVIGVSLFLSEGPGVRHDLSLLVYAAGFCSAAIASLLTALRAPGLAIVFALPFAGLGAVELLVAELAAVGVGSSCKGGCPPASARAGQDLLGVALAGYANLVAAAAIVVLSLVAIIIWWTAAAARRSPGDPERPRGNGP